MPARAAGSAPAWSDLPLGRAPSASPCPRSRVQRRREPARAALARDLAHGTASGGGGAGVAVVERPPIEIGTDIYRSVFQGQVRTLLDKSRGHLERSPDVGLRLKIKLDPGDADTAALADLPWELLCDGETEDFLALSRQTSVVRYLDVPRSSQPIAFTPPLRILAVGASPSELPPLDLAEEARRLEALQQSGSGVEVRFLANASAGAVREALAGDSYNVLHFMGHGTFDRASGDGMLAFEGAGGRLDLVNGRAFATKLRDLRSLGVVVLNACNTARAGGQDGSSPFRGVATALVQGGVPAVVAMQRPISDRAAIGFSSAVYRHLARGDSIDEALTEGRQAIHSAEPEGFEWATPVLFLRIPEGNVFVTRPAAAGLAAPGHGHPAPSHGHPAPGPAHDHGQPVAVPAAVAAIPAHPADPATGATVQEGRAARGSRSTTFKVAAGAASVSLVAGSLYFVVPRPAAAPGAAAPEPATQPVGNGGAAASGPPVGDAGQGADRNLPFQSCLAAGASGLTAGSAAVRRVVGCSLE